MAISKTIVKMNHIEALVKVVADAAGSVTIDLDVDLLKSNEVLNGETPIVNIGAIEHATANGGVTTITRNGTLVMNMFENTVGFELPWGADTQLNTNDIVVALSAAGTVYIRLLKVKGYAPTFRPEQGVNL